VLTLVARPDAVTVGAVYFVEAPHEELLLALDHRERAGYARITLEVMWGALRLPAVTWIAPPGNEHDVGQLELGELAALMRVAVGPSGRNDDYVFQLERALQELGGADPQVSALAVLLRR
jgi:cation transport regulator ChaC